MQVVEKNKPETVEQLVQLVKEKYNLPDQEVVEHIIRLQNEGRLAFVKHLTAQPPKPKDYILSTSATWYWTIVALALVTSVSVFTVPENAYPIVYARYVFGFIFVLFLPGYSLIKTLFRARELDSIERVALSIGASMVLALITGLFLNYAPWGIRTTPVTLSLVAQTIAFSTVAIVRDHRRQEINDSENPRAQQK